MSKSYWQQKELIFLVLYAVIFYAIVIRRSLQLSHDHDSKLYGLRPGWIAGQFNDASDSQWRNFRGNLPILTTVLVIFTLVANVLRTSFSLKAKGMSIVWILISLRHICHRYCINKFFPRKVVLRMISFGHDYHWTEQDSRFDRKKHVQHCDHCSSGKTCYLLLQVTSSQITERRVTSDKFSFPIYLCYLVYAPLYIAGPIISFNAFSSQLDSPQNIYSTREVAVYGLRWVFSLSLMELMTHLFYYNAFAISGVWKQLSPIDIFIIGYGVLNFMWLKFLLIWRYFRFWSLINGIVAPENMPRCVNNCHNLESFWKNWHASFNKWLVRYVYIPLGGSQKKLLNVWVVFTFVAVWHDLEWKLLSWAWLTCIFFIPEMLVKSAANAFPVDGSFKEFVFRELRAVAGAITITCLMVANLVGFVIGPSGIDWLVFVFIRKEGLPTLGGLLITFYIGTKKSRLVLRELICAYELRLWIQDILYEFYVFISIKFQQDLGEEDHKINPNPNHVFVFLD
ncbi:putative membrane-bound o-acyltransferase c24h6.01c [Phtheirospermum japonicum]|uniref:Putative membrane-bound o-acyltransferase c24h6.01c n=1 Tax=Phtheirospermum japonicum TaxID=374723 RepID=A0A830C6G6_9LAMI|nr:putative membrane-bound o-acyltransferase c24h6.01c [Phtheirospermum japonicum]